MSIITNRFIQSKKSKRKRSFEPLERSEKKANLDLEEDWDLEIPLAKPKINVVDYDSCLIGSSMIKDIDSKLVFPNSKRCFFKSISGGKIKDVYNFLKNRENLLKNSKYFIVTCGSNDCDSLSDIKDVLNDYLEMALYLKNTFNTSCLIFNKLIPRTKCRYVSLLDFEKRRNCFNTFLEIIVPLTVSDCIIVDHLAFEMKTDLNDLLLDGVHISPLKGLPIYIEQIKNKLK